MGEWTKVKLAQGYSAGRYYRSPVPSGLVLKPVLLTSYDVSQDQLLNKKSDRYSFLALIIVT